MPTPTDRRFLVGRDRGTVFIREVDPTSCSFTRNRVDAWNRAKQAAKGHKASQNPFIRKQADSVIFIDLDMREHNLNVRDFLPAEPIKSDAPAPVASVPAEAPSAPAKAEVDILKALTS